MKMLETIGFVGGGRVTRFLLEGWKHSGAMPAGVRVADTSPDILGALKGDFPDITPVSTAEAAAADLVVLAVHPPALKDVLAAVKPCLQAEATILSLAPKFTAAMIAGALGASRVVRMIPNAPSAIGRGYNPVAYSTGMDADTRTALAALFTPWGNAPEVAEKELEAYAIITAMGPTYLWFQWQVLRQLAAGFGLGPAAADRALLKMIEGSAACLLAAGRDPAKVMDMIPVKPLKDEEAAWSAAYRAKLSGLYEKIKT